MLLTPLYWLHFAKNLHTLPTGHISNIFLPIWLLASFVLTLACDRSTLPYGALITQSGPVLKLICPRPLRSMEVFNVNEVQPASSRFARYMCIGGTTFHQISVDGIKNSSFICTDRNRTSCFSLVYSSLEGNVHYPTNQSVAIWRPHNGSPSLLYCVLGTWHRFGGGDLPQGITIRQDSNPQTEPLISSTTHTSFLKSSTMPPPNHLPILYKFYLDQLFHVQSTPSDLAYLYITSTLPPDLLAVSKISSENLQVLNDDEVDKELHDIYRFVRITFTYLVVLGLVGVVVSVFFFCFLRRRRKYVDIEADLARQKLEQVIALV